MFADVFKIGSQLWKETSEAQKESLKAEFKRDYAVYSVQLAKYNESLTREQKEEISEAVQDLKEEREKRKERLAIIKKNKELEKPVKPLSSYLLFCSTEQKNRGSLSIGEFQVLVSEKWRNLAESEKQKYSEQAKKAHDAYEKELSAWEEKMVKLGNLDLVRQKTLNSILEKTE